MVNASFFIYRMAYGKSCSHTTQPENRQRGQHSRLRWGCSLTLEIENNKFSNDYFIKFIKNFKHQIDNKLHSFYKKYIQHNNSEIYIKVYY